MTKLHITLTLTDEEAQHLVQTMKLGAKAWYGAGLMRDADTLAQLVQRRVDDAIEARGRKRRREDQRAIANEYIVAIGRASLAASEAGREFTEDEREAIRNEYRRKALGVKTDDQP